MVDKRSLRSNKPTNSASTNGEKVTSPTQSQESIPNSQNKTVTAKSPPTRSKPVPGKKGVINSEDTDMGEDKHQTNGSDQLQNGVNGTSEDIEMEDESVAPGTGVKTKDKDGDEEMTVVVPPSKTAKASGTTGKGQDGDMDVDGMDKNVDTPEEVKVDPVAKAVSGLYTAPTQLSSRPQT
jgi:26S proteasome regulatory subunit N3